MSWLSRLNPRGPGSRSGRTAAPLSPCTADPETCLMVFKNHWRQVSWVLDQRESSSSSDDLTAVRNNTDQMLCLLAEERPAESSEGGFGVASMGPILELVITENILERLVQWHLCRGLDPDSQGALLKLFEMLIGQSQQPLLQHTAVLHPLLRLLGACADPELGCPLALENSLVLLLNQVCVSMARQPMILELLFRASPAQQGSTNLLIFSLLVPFIHRDGAIGQQARDALLLVMAASASHESAARYIAENSYFCPVLATGLSALYSSLPRKIEVRGDDWHALRREDWMGVSSLVLFMNSLEFCNAVVQVAHPTVSSQLLDYLHNGFLVPVMGPALHKSSVDEMIASTAYLDLFLRSITETSLLKTFLRFILLHRHDNDTILDTLLTRISSNSRLCMVSLSLFRTLLSLNCEDVMLQLVFRYLLPCTHVMLSQRRAIRETDMYGKCADKFLSLIPECCRQYTAASSERDEDNPFWSKVLNSPGTDIPAAPRPSTPSRLSLFMRQHAGGGGSGGGNLSSSTSLESLQSGPSGSRPLSPDSPMHQHGHTDCLDWDAGFLEYLKDARRGIEVCSWACRDWSAPYDGENPSPNTAPPPPPPPTSNPSMAMFPEHFSFHQGVSSSTPPGQQRAAIVAAARSEWSSSDRDSGEWDVTIGQNNCISLTPRSKKRSLQRDELLPKPVPPLIPSSSTAAPLSASHSMSSPAAHIPTSAITVNYQAMFNGTARQGDECSDSHDRGLEVKKVKRDLGEPQYLDENANQNGSMVSCPSLPKSLFSNRDIGDAKSFHLNQTSSQCSPSQLAPDAYNSRSTCSDPPETNPSQQSVESLLEELLEQAPGDPQMSADANGQGISIEAFTLELRKLEDRVKERSRPACKQEPSAAETLPAEQQEEEEQLPTAPEAKGDASVMGAPSPARPVNQPTSQPYTGPFMVVLFAKLENMLQNSLYVNILLTGIVAQLACYPQPLLRSFLLNTNMVFQPSVKSLIQVLGSVKNRIEAFAASHEDFPVMLRKAQQYLVARGKLDWTDLPAAVPTLRRSESLVKSRKPSLGDLILRHTNSPTRARNAAQLALAHVRDGGQSLHSALFRGGGGSGGGGASGLEKQAEALRVKNAVYCTVIFCEFLKELAALAQEHAVREPPAISGRLSATDGQVVTLNCSIRYHCPSRPPTLQWRWERGPLLNSTELWDAQTTYPDVDAPTLLASLSFTASHQVKPRLKCEVNYPGAKMVSTTTDLHVTFPPKEVRIQVQTLVVHEGGTALLVCSCKADPPVSEYRWSYSQHGRTVHLHHRTHTVRVFNVTRDMRVTCSAHNSIGRGESQPTALNIQYKPFIHRLSSNCSVEDSELVCCCLVDSNPKAAVTWSVNGTIPPHGFNVSASSDHSMLTASLTGRMEKPLQVVCFAFNALGNDSLVLLQGEEEVAPLLWLVLPAAAICLLMTLLSLLVCWHRRKAQKKSLRGRPIFHPEDLGIYQERMPLYINCTEVTHVYTNGSYQLVYQNCTPVFVRNNQIRPMARRGGGIRRGGDIGQARVGIRETRQVQDTSAELETAIYVEIL